MHVNFIGGITRPARRRDQVEQFVTVKRKRKYSRMVHFASNGRAICAIGYDRDLCLQPNSLIRQEAFDLYTHIVGGLPCHTDAARERHVDIAVARHCDGLQRGRLRADALGAKRRRGVTLSEKSAACFNYCDLHDVADGDAQICGGSVALEVAAKPILPPGKTGTAGNERVVHSVPTWLAQAAQSHRDRADVSILGRRGTRDRLASHPLGNLALSGAGLLIIEATAVLPEGRISPDDLGLWSAKTEKALGRVVETVRRYSDMPIAIQLAHAGPRKPNALSPRSIRCRPQGLHFRSLE